MFLFSIPVQLMTVTEQTWLLAGADIWFIQGKGQRGEVSPRVCVCNVSIWMSIVRLVTFT